MLMIIFLECCDQVVFPNFMAFGLDFCNSLSPHLKKNSHDGN